LINDDFGIIFELYLFATNIKKEVCGVLEYFLFKKRNEKKVSQHAMFDVKPKI
jgi:hypothetical protein